MITFDQNTLLALLPVAGTALLAMLVVIADIAWPNRDRLIVTLAAGGIVVLMAVTVIVGPLGFSGNAAAGTAEEGAAITQALTDLVVPFLRDLDRLGWKRGTWMSRIE